MYGKQSALLTWFGKSLRPVAITASGRASRASTGSISGTGFASARITGRSAIALTMAGFSTLPAETPRNTSAPSTSSSSVRAWVLRA